VIPFYFMHSFDSYLLFPNSEEKIFYSSGCSFTTSYFEYGIISCLCISKTSISSCPLSYEYLIVY